MIYIQPTNITSPTQPLKIKTTRALSTKLSRSSKLISTRPTRIPIKPPVPVLPKQVKATKSPSRLPTAPPPEKVRSRSRIAVPHRPVRKNVHTNHSAQRLSPKPLQKTSPKLPQKTSPKLPQKTLSKALPKLVQRPTSKAFLKTPSPLVQKNAQDRPPSYTTPKKSPVAQMKETLEKEQQKVEECQQKIEQQANVLDQLRAESEVQEQMYKQTLSEKEKEISEQQQIITTLRQTLEERNQEFAVIKASHQLEEENSNKRERENEQKPQSISIGTNTTPVSIETHTPQKKYNDASTQTIRKRTPTQLQTAPNMDEAIERLLNEIEQAEHTHRPEISTQVSLPPSPPPHHHSKPFLSKRPLSNQWDQRFLPTEAVSWPTPQSLSVLRKTSTQETPNRYSSAISTTISTNYTQEDEALFREIEQEINSGKMLDLCLEDF